jgi:hypothetical protein
MPNRRGQCGRQALREREQSGVAVGGVQAIMRSLRNYLEGDFEACRKEIEIGKFLARRDPETLYYLAHHLARIDEKKRAITLLSSALEGGFLCATAIARDPWLEPLLLR